jgi:hypothetical protein
MACRRPKCTYTHIGKHIVFHPLNLLDFGDGRRHEEDDVNEEEAQGERR